MKCTECLSFVMCRSRVDGDRYKLFRLVYECEELKKEIYAIPLCEGSKDALCIYNDSNTFYEIAKAFNIRLIGMKDE